MIFNKPIRHVEKVFIHCSASDDMALAGQDLIQAITEWHRQRHFVTIGYHYVIDKNGAILAGRDIEMIPAAQEGFNSGSIAICVHGLKFFTEASFDALRDLCQAIDTSYDHGLTFHGHCEVNPYKACPVFDYRAILSLDPAGQMKYRDHLLEEKKDEDVNRSTV